MSDKPTKEEIKIIVTGDSKNGETILNTYKNKIVGEDYVRTVYVLLFYNGDRTYTCEKININYITSRAYILLSELLVLFLCCCFAGLTYIP